MELIGLDQVPEAGDRFYVLDSIDKARDIAESRIDKRRKETLMPSRGVDWRW